MYRYIYIYIYTYIHNVCDCWALAQGRILSARGETSRDKGTTPEIWRHLSIGKGTAPEILVLVRKCKYGKTTMVR